MEIVCLHDRKEIEYFLMKNVYLNIYHIGDLDDFFWKHTIWYGLKEDDNIRAIALIYAGLREPSLLASSVKEDVYMDQLLEGIKTYLPKRFYGHLNESGVKMLQADYESEYFGTYIKMGLERNELTTNSEDTSEVVRLSKEDLGLINALYMESYQDTWFEERMLDTGMYFGIKKGEDRLISIAGIHTFSPKHKVASVGNITTHPDYRGKGLCRKTLTKLCKELFKFVDYIGLYVKDDNINAINSYNGIGFKEHGRHEECLFK